MSDPRSDSLVILLHGVGSRGADIAGLAQSWKSVLPGTIFAAPDAPHPSSFGSGHQWFSVAGVTEENRPGRIAAARASFDAVISAIVADNGFSDRLDRVAFGGFSQGTIMALDAIASGRWPVAALVGYSGRLASPPPLAPSVGTNVLLVHGDADSVMPLREIDKAASTLKDHGLAVDTLVLAGVGHAITTTGAERGGAFLAGVLGR